MSQVLILNQSAIPLRWAPILGDNSAVFYKAKGLVAHEFGDKQWIKCGGVNRITGLRTEMEISSMMILRGNHMPKRNVPALTNPNLFGRDLNVCAYCGGEFEFRQLTRDHVVPTSRGGLNSWTNCVTACKRCNNAKGSFLLQECGMSLLYVPYVPSREEGLILSGKKILADQMDFLKASLPAHSRLHDMKPYDA